MKAVLIGSDFLKLENEIKFLETNTDVDLHETVSHLLELDNLMTYLTTNMYTKLIISYKKRHVVQSVINLFQAACDSNNIQLELIVIPNNSITTPSVNLESTTFYLRCAYDSTAIIDDIYCRDKAEMVKLLFESNHEDLLPKTCVRDLGDDNSMFDNLSNLVDNNQNPNIIVKKTLPDFEKTEYPAFYKIDTETDLNDLKSTVNGTNMLQEYKFNENTLVNGRISNVIRTWTLLLEDVETMIYLGGCIYTNTVPLNENGVTYTNTKLDNKWRSMYFSNPVNSTGMPSEYEVIKIVDDQEISIDLNSVAIGDIVKSVSLVGLDKNELSNESLNWSSILEISDLMTYSTASVVSKLTTTFQGWLPKIEYSFQSSTGSTLVTTNEKLLIKENNTGIVKFKIVTDIEDTDSLVISDQVTAEITSINLEWYSGSITTINIEPDDVFIAGTNLNSISGTNLLGSVIAHNYFEKI
jgi:hypothetical protein